MQLMSVACALAWISLSQVDFQQICTKFVKLLGRNRLFFERTQWHWCCKTQNEHQPLTIQLHDDFKSYSSFHKLATNRIMTMCSAIAREREHGTWSIHIARSEMLTLDLWMKLAAQHTLQKHVISKRKTKPQICSKLLLFVVFHSFALNIFPLLFCVGRSLWFMYAYMATINVQNGLLEKFSLVSSRSTSSKWNYVSVLASICCRVVISTWVMLIIIFAN